MPDLYIDIDAHAVYTQALHAAQRYALELYVVTRDYLQTDPHIHLIPVEDTQTNSGAWIAANISRGDICVTGDSGLAASCMLRGATALLPSGREWSGGLVGEEPRTIAAGVREPWSLDPRTFAQRLEKAIASTRGATRHPFAAAREPVRRGPGSAAIRPLMRRKAAG